MEITIDRSPLTELTADVLVVGQWEGEAFEGVTVEVDRLLDGALSEAAGFADAADLTGKKGEVHVFFTRGKLAAPRVAVVGLGKREEAGAQTIREASGTALRKLRERKVRSIATTLHLAIDAADSAAAAVEGALVGEWEPGTYKSKNGLPVTIDRLILADGEGGSGVEEGLRRGRILGESVNTARDLVNEPPNELPPAKLAQRAAAVAADTGLGYDVLDEDAMQRFGMGGILAVSLGSENRARLVVMKHQPNPGGPALALVGKGITFDTGGISIKPRENMHEMKGDMAGAAAVVGAMRAIALLKLPVNVVGLIPCAENMPSGKAYRPGDVIRFMNGKTTEIISTDAEGRMVLADALTYAIRNLGSPRVVDVATLTGACVIALGNAATGAFGNDPEWMQAVRSAADAAGERFWELPLFEEYRPLLKSEIADFKNSGGPRGGAITGAMFLKEFVDDTPWVHLDIAGTASIENPPAHLSKGATGVMVRTFVHLTESLTA